MIIAYDHNQATPATTWVVVHNMERKPVVQVRNTSGSVIEADVTHNSDNQLTLTFNTPMAGRASCS